MSDDYWSATPVGVVTVLREEIEIRNARIEALTAERDTLIVGRDMMGRLWEKEQARANDLKAKLDMVVETLEFYGDERNYESEYIPDECGCCGSWYEPKIHKDGQDSGDYARTTLAELTGGKP